MSKTHMQIEEHDGFFSKIPVHYRKKLLIPGWAGLLDLDEARYIQSRLVTDERLRRRWGIRHKVPPLSLIAEKAFPENPEAARRNIRAEQTRERRRISCKVKMSPAIAMSEKTK